MPRIIVKNKVAPFFRTLCIFTLRFYDLYPFAVTYLYKVRPLLILCLTVVMFLHFH